MAMIAGVVEKISIAAFWFSKLLELKRMKVLFKVILLTVALNFSSTLLVAQTQGLELIEATPASETNTRQSAAPLDNELGRSFPSPSLKGSGSVKVRTAPVERKSAQQEGNTQSAVSSRNKPKRSFFGLPIESMKGGISLGLTYVREPSLDWSDSRHLLILEGEEDGIVTENKIFKDGLGLSLEYSQFLYQGVFAGVGADIWKKTKARHDKSASIFPVTLYINAGLFQSFDKSNGLFKMFGGVGFSRLGYEYDFVGVDFDESIGFVSHFGLGAVFHNFFIDFFYRFANYSYREGSDIPGSGNTLNSYRKRGKINMYYPMLRVGVFF